MSIHFYSKPSLLRCNNAFLKPIKIKRDINCCISTPVYILEIVLVLEVETTCLKGEMLRASIFSIDRHESDSCVRRSAICATLCISRPVCTSTYELVFKPFRDHDVISDSLVVPQTWRYESSLKYVRDTQSHKLTITRLQCENLMRNSSLLIDILANHAFVISLSMLRYGISLPIQHFTSSPQDLIPTTSYLSPKHPWQHHTTPSSPPSASAHYPQFASDRRNCSTRGSS